MCALVVIATLFSGCDGETTGSLPSRFAARRDDLEELKNIVVSEHASSRAEVFVLRDGWVSVRFRERGIPGQWNSTGSVDSVRRKRVGELLGKLGAISAGVLENSGKGVFVLMESGGPIGGGLGYAWHEMGKPLIQGTEVVTRIPGEDQWFYYVQ